MRTFFDPKSDTFFVPPHMTKLDLKRCHFGTLIHYLRPPPSLASSCSSSFHPLAERTKKNDPNTPFVSHLVAGYSTPKGHDPSAEKGLEPQRWCSGHGSGPPGSSSWASFSSSSSAAAAEVEGDGCLLEALRSVDDEIDRAGGADAAAELARF